MGDYYFSSFDSSGNLIKDFRLGNGYPFDFKTYPEGEIYLKCDGGDFPSYSYFYDRFYSIVWKKRTSSTDSMYFYDSPILYDSNLYGFGIKKVNQAYFKNYFIKTNYHGEIKWTIPKETLLDSFEKNIQGYSLGRYYMKDDKLVLTYSSDNYPEKYLLLNTDGNIILKDSFCNVVQKPKYWYRLNNGSYGVEYVKTADSQTYFILYRYDDSCELEWQYTTPNFKFDAHIHFVSSDKSDNFYFLIYEEEHLVNTNFHTLKIDSKGNGKILSSFELQESWTLDQVGCKLTHDNGFLITAVKYGVWLIKTDSNGMFSSDEVKFFSHTKRNNTKPVIVVFPNPMTTSCIFSLPKEMTKESTLCIYNLQGKLVREETFNGQRYEFERGDLKSGFYIYFIRNEAFSYTGKILVE